MLLDAYSRTNDAEYLYYIGKWKDGVRVQNDNTFLNNFYDDMYTILQPDRVPDMVQSMLTIFKQQGKLPIWPLMGSETDCMVGYSAVPVIADAYFKGFGDFDPQFAFQAMKASSMPPAFLLEKISEAVGE